MNAHSKLKLPIHVANESTFSANKGIESACYMASLPLIVRAHPRCLAGASKRA